MKKALSILVLCIMALFSHEALAQKPEIRKFAFDDNGIVQSMSDNGQWALVAFGTTELAEMGNAKIVNVQTGKYEDIQTEEDITLNGKQTFCDITDDGEIVVGAFKGNAAYWKKSTHQWVMLPTPAGSSGAVATNVTPDGKYAIGQGLNSTNAYYKAGVMWDLQKGTLIELPNVPTLDMNHENQQQCQFISISSDGRFILGSLSYSYLQPVAPCVFLYDRNTSTAKFIGFNPDDKKAWTPWVEGLMFLDEGKISSNGKYVTCHAWMYSEGTNGMPNVEGDAVAYYEVESGKFEILAGSSGMFANTVDDNGTVYAASPAGSPIREWAVFHNGYWYPISQILKQRYGMDFYNLTNYGNTGSVSDISADAKTLTVMVDPTGESYAMTLPDAIGTLCEDINLLDNYSVSPKSGTSFTKLRSIEITFDRDVEFIGNADAASLTKADGTLVRNSAGMAVSTQSKKMIVVTFRPQTLAEGETYTVNIPAGTICLAGDHSKVNEEIRIKYTGRADKAVTMQSVYPKDGTMLSKIDNSSNPVVVTFDAQIALTENASAELRLIKEEGGHEKVCNLNTSVSENFLYVFPTAIQYLYIDKKYQVVINKGSVTDFSGTGANEEIVLNYVGSYIREVSYDNATLFKDDFSNQAQSLLNFMRYEGDHLKPTAEMQAWGFDADNQPWNFSIRENETSTDYCAASTSMYSPAGKSDDWMVIPQLEIPDEYVSLTFKAQSYKKNKGDKLKVLVWECEENINALTSGVIERMRKEAKVVLDASLTPGTSEENLSGEWTEYNVDLAAYNGKKIYIAFLNENEDQSAVFVDDIAVVREMKFFVSLTNENSVVNQESITIAGTLTVNAENETFSSAKLTLKDNSGNKIDEIHATGLSLQKGDKYTFSFNNPLPLTKGIANKCVISVEMGAYTDDVICIVKNLAFEPVKRVVLEEFTGVTCGNCPQGILAMEQLHFVYSDLVIPVCIHAYPGDPFEAGLSGYASYLGLSAAPSAMIQRSGIISYPMGEDPATGKYTFSNGYTLWKDLVAAEFEVPSDAEIAAEYKINENGTFDLPVTVKYALDANNLNLNLFVVMLEDDIHSYQMNYFASNSDPAFGEWGQGGKYSQSVVYDYAHHDLARACWGTSYSGTAGLLPQSMKAGEAYTAELTGFDMPENIDKTGNTKVVVMLVDGNTNKLINAVCVKPANGTGIENVNNGKNLCNITSENGKITITGNGYISAKVHTTAGTLIGSASGKGKITAGTTNHKGIAIVSTTMEGKTIIKKVLLQ